MLTSPRRRPLAAAAAHRQNQSERRGWIHWIDLSAAPSVLVGEEKQRRTSSPGRQSISKSTDGFGENESGWPSDPSYLLEKVLLRVNITKIDTNIPSKVWDPILKLEY